MTAPTRLLLLSAGAVLFAGCVSMPTGPTVTVMPSPYKPFDVFVQDENTCRSFAANSISGQEQKANDKAVATAVGGTLLGAAAGALIGQSGGGAGVGAGIGLVGGSMYGGSSAQQSDEYLQYRYNVAYEQCMYSHGNQVPGFTPAVPVGPPPPPRSGQPAPQQYAPQPYAPPPYQPQH